METLHLSEEEAMGRIKDPRRGEPEVYKNAVIMFSDVHTYHQISRYF